jgi:uncharacterized membrane protein
MQPNVAPQERRLTALGGGALLAAGLARRGALGAVLGITGLGLLLRGASGRCPFYRRLGVDTAHGRPLRRELELRRAITIDASTERIREFVRDPAKLAELLPFVDRASELGAEEWQLEARLPGGARSLMPMKSCEDASGNPVWRGARGSPVSEVALHLDPAPEARGTEVRVVVKGRAPGGIVGALAAHGLKGAAERALGARLARLKQQLETRETASAGPQPEAPRSFAHRMAAGFGQAVRGST